MSTRFTAEVIVMPRPEVADPQGAAIEKALVRHAADEGTTLALERLRVGRVFRFRIEAPDRREAERQVQALADRVLANPNVETFTCTVLED